MKSFTENEVLEIMKAWVHEQRKSLKHADNLNAVYFASDLMVKLCAKPAFEENEVLTFIKNYEK